MNKTERLYAFALARHIVTTEALADWAMENLGKGYAYLYSKYIRRLLAQGKLVRVTRGLYAARNVYSSSPYDNVDTPPNKYLVGANLRREYYLGYHTALELHGCAYSVTTDCITVTSDAGKFRPFDHGNQRFINAVSRDLVTEVVRMRVLDQEVIVSSPSRTFVECIRRLDLSGGLEELLKSADGLRGVTTEGLDRAMGIYGYDILYRSVGFFLELMRDESPFYGSITQDYIDGLRGRIGTTPRYLMKGSHSRLDKAWNLYVPRGIGEVIEGVR